MDLRSLRHFIAVVDTGSLTRAAASVHLAQPALTAQIKRLESEFGVRLLDRSSTGVTPTPAGRQLYLEAARLLADAQAVRSRLSGRGDEPEGNVSLVAMVSLVYASIGGVLVRARSHLPRVRIDVTSDTGPSLLDAITEGRVDFGLIAEPPESLRLRFCPLAVEPYVFAGLDPRGLTRPLLIPTAEPPGPATYHRLPAIRMADALALPLVIQSQRYLIRRQLQAAGSAVGVTPNVIHEYDANDVIRAAYAAGAGFTFAPVSSRSPCAGDPDEIHARVIDPGLERTIGIAWLPGRPLGAAAQAVIALLRTEIAEAIAGGRWAARHVDRDDYRFA